MATNELQLVIRQTQKLSFQEQLELIKYLAERLQPATTNAGPRYLEYGKYRQTPGRVMSTEEDFALAEWRPTEEELDGD